MDFTFILKILLAAALGGIIGLEREFAQKEAGLRTNILIAIGSTLLTIVSQQIAGASADPARLTAQVVSGVGFLGAGAIIQARFAVQGLTTAAGIWMVAALGIAVGSGLYLPALLITLLAVAVLTLLRIPVKFLSESRKNYVYLIKTGPEARILIEIKQVLTELGLRNQHVSIIKKKNGFHVEVVFESAENKNNLFLERLLLLKEIREISNDQF